MIMISNGIDIVEVKRIEKLIKKEKFLKRIYSESELEYLESRKFKATTAAGIFSAKEAVSKCIGTGIAGFNWDEIVISSDEFGKPHVELLGKALLMAEEMGISDIEVSITHSDEYAAASAIGQMKKNWASIPEPPVKILKRKKDTHKGDYGRIGVLGGKKGMSGAVYMAGQSALKSGSGLVHVLAPEVLHNILAVKFNEVIIEELDFSKDFLSCDDYKNIEKKISEYDSLCIGPGIGRDESTVKLICEVIKMTDVPIVLDADGLNCISENLEVLESRNGDIIVTPHPGEMSRLTGYSISHINENRVEVAREFSLKYGAVTVLKGHNTVVANGDDVYINKTGNPGMATAGSGDVLTGIIGSLVGQGFGLMDSAKLGVYLHGLAGDMAKKKYGEYGLTAMNIIEYIPDAFAAAY
ncbi:NAD(P)H-hydrate epimerase [Dethiosulfatibacter aminovorans DSM 17477]|uniref:Multifunctional fusion protein n=2 Tax=Dethiosulfatibacter TaxID=448125 RepID=A0A1M6DNJ2_9FIRM|nr:NAD(P)H-hydrate epimerase [Dethiosulfatibacter aminovorans DSM 17477]